MTAPLRPGPPRAVRRPALGGRAPGGLAHPFRVHGLLWTRGPLRVLALVGLGLAAPRALAAAPKAAEVPPWIAEPLAVAPVGGGSQMVPPLADRHLMAQAPLAAPASRLPAALSPPAAAAPTPTTTAQPASPLPPGPVFSPDPKATWSVDPASPFYSIGPAPASPPGLGLPSAPGGLLPARPGPTPQAISAPRPQIPPCPLIVPAKDFALQPLHIPPSQVPFKNSLGCLSAADALYGPDGCPRRLCGSDRGVRLTLPPGGP